MNRLLTFFSLTFLVSWTCFAGAAVMGGGTLSPPPGTAILTGAIFLLGVIAPSLTALVLTARTSGRAGIATLLRQVINCPRQIRWYVFAVGYMAVIKLAAAVVHRIGTGEWPPFGRVTFFLIVLAILFSTPVQAGEEVGWRGYALPHLSFQFGLSRASLTIGIIWAFWHLPLFFIPGSDTYHQSFLLALLGITPLSVAMAWLYWRSNGSLLLTMLMHAAVNNTTTIVPSASPAVNPFSFSSSIVGWTTVVLLWACAAYFLSRMRGARLQPIQENT